MGEEQVGREGEQERQRARVLFLCTGNSCRSQMAEAWARELHKERIEAFSAGTRPGGLNPRAKRVMEEAGVDMAGYESKHVDSLLDLDFDLVVTVCDSARQACPTIPGAARQIHVGFDDPPQEAQAAENEEQALAIFRRIRDEIRDFIETLPEVVQAPQR